MSKQGKNKKKIAKIFGFIGLFLAVAVLVFGGMAFYSYNNSLNYKRGDGKEIDFSIEEGDTISSIGKELEKYKLINSKFFFNFYAKNNKLDKVKVGKYQLNSNMTMAEILKTLNDSPNSKKISITFLPGGTIKNAKNVLVKAGFSSEEVDSALAKDYSGKFKTLFSGKPKNVDNEGYFWGETHNFEKGVTVQEIVERFFADFEKKIEEKQLVKKYASHNLSLYQGITLASIVQKESLGSLDDMKKIAGVFYNRLEANMTLGSDVTYQYIADKNKLDRDVNLESPYNLRIKKGLTPTPIATPGVNALEAVANPVKHEYLFFLSGDDDITYFAKTDAQHQQNIKKHCQKKCQII